MADVYQWRRVLHIPFMIILQIIFIILFALFVRYDPKEALGPRDPTFHKKTTPSDSNLTDVSDISSSSQEEDKTYEDSYAAKEFEANLIKAIADIKESSNPNNSADIHDDITSLESSLIKFIKDRSKTDHESSQEHGVHQTASALISNVYPCMPHLISPERAQNEAIAI